MPLAGSDYLLRLAGLALSFVGFSAIIVALRRASGGELNDLHLVVPRFFIETGLAITAFSVLPGALHLTGMPVSTTWRIASAAAALLGTALAVSLLRRARSVKSGSIPGLQVNFAISIVPLATIWLNAIGFPFGPSADPYALALTALLFLIFWIFLQNLEAFIRPASPG